MRAAGRAKMRRRRATAGDTGTVRARDVLSAEAWKRLQAQPGWERLVARLARGVRHAPRIAAAAALVPQARTMFLTFFSVITGWTYGQFVTAWRLTEAWCLCHAAPDLPLAEVAMRVGYGNAPALVRAYCAFWGETPRGRRTRIRRRVRRATPGGGRRRRRGRARRQR